MKQVPKYFRVYVVECKTPGYWYVGSTTRPHWTTLHGFKRMVLMELVPKGTCKALEDALTVWMQCRFGWRFVRGGDRVATSEKKLRRWLHEANQLLGPTDVLPLHARPMGEFPAELRRLINRFEMICGFENADHLDADVLP